MITIERELLERAAALLNPDRSPSALFHQRRDCADAIRAALAVPATAPDELERLRTEYEERLQNCAALVAEVEQLREDAERNPMHEGEIQAAWLGHGIEEPMPYTFELGIRSAERFNGIKEKS